MSSEISVEIFNIPADNEAAVLGVLMQHGLAEDDYDPATLVGGDYENYYAGNWECEDVASELAALNVSFRLSYRSDADGWIEYDPELGERRMEMTSEGYEAYTAYSFEQLLKLTSVEEIHAKIHEITGKAWSDKFKAYDALRAGA